MAHPMHKGYVKKQRPQHTWPTLRRLWQYLKRQPFVLTIVTAATLLATGLQLAGPYLIGKGIDQYIVPKTFDGFAGLCLLLLGIYSLGSFLSWLQNHMLPKLSQRIVWQLRSEVFSHLQQLPVRYFDQTTHGELMSRTTNDIENVSAALNLNITQMISSVIMLLGSLLMMLSLNVPLTGVALLSIPLVLFITKLITSRTQKLFKQQQHILGQLNGFIEETISGQKVVKLFHQEKTAAGTFQGMNEQLKHTATRAQNLSGLMGPFMNMLNHTSYILIAAVGGWMALNGSATIGIIVSFLTYSKQFSWPLTQLANQYNMIQSGVAGAERVFDLLDTQGEFDGAHEEQPERMISPMRGEVTFHDVSFKYTDDQHALKDVTFQANAGQLIALVGPTGAGKTTIVNLLTRFYDIAEGMITIDEKDIRQWDKRVLRKHIGMVLQDAYVFSGTIRDNIRYGRLSASDEAVEDAAKKANADAFIRKLPLGYETVLTAEGRNISHGQRQLLTIARAILADPAILVLDEATSSIDTRTEMQIQEALKLLMRGRTSFVIAHRLHTIRNADQILFIQDGQIAESGTHASLLSQKGHYYQLYKSQFQQQEAAL